MKKIPLTQGQFALVDDADFESLSKIKWSAENHGRTFYAKNRKHGMMHRFLLNAKKGFLVDHSDGNGLNNQRSNIRECTASENCRNRNKMKGTHSKLKGFYHYVRDNKWGARIVVNGKRVWLGYFYSENDAAKAYDMAAKHYFGEFANLNFE